MLKTIINYSFLLAFFVIFLGFLGYVITFSDQPPPVEKIKEMVGLSENDGIYPDSADIFSPDLNDKIDKIRVKNTHQLLKALGPDRKIILANGKYDIYGYLFKAALKNNPELNIQHITHLNQCLQAELEDTTYVECQASNIIFKNLHNVIIEGGKNSSIVTPEGATSVLILKDCQNVALKKLTLKHTVELCWDPVLGVHNCRNILIHNCILDGSGTVGIDAHNNQNLSIIGNTIQNCSLEIVYLKNCMGETKFTDNTCKDNGPIITMDNCGLLYFNGNTVRNNRRTDTSAYPFMMIKTKSLYFHNNIITENKSNKGIIINAAGVFDQRGIYKNEFDDSVLVLQGKITTPIPL
jgi:hypothetical protein